MHLWIRAVALLIYGGQHPIEHKSSLDEGHPTTSDPSAIHLQNYQLLVFLPIGIAQSKIHFGGSQNSNRTDRELRIVRFWQNEVEGIGILWI
jgi:hypothetical protein